VKLIHNQRQFLTSIRTSRCTSNKGS